MNARGMNPTSLEPERPGVRLTPQNRSKAKLNAGGYSFGTWAGPTTRNPAVMRTAAAAGFDFVYIDCEHSSLSLETVGDLCGMARACGIAPIVRVGEFTRHAAARYLDIGAMGLMFHDVDDRETAETVVGWVRAWGNPSEIQVIVQIESLAAIENVDDILSVDGIDSIEIGRGSLATALGYPGQRDHPKVWEAIDKIVASCKRHNVAPGMVVLGLNEDEVVRFVQHGFRAIGYGLDGHILQQAYAQGMKWLTKATAPPPRPADG